MYTIGLKLRLKAGRYEDYKQAHDDLWPELAEGMTRCHVSMSIWRDGDDLFLFAAAPTEADWNRSREDRVLDRWNAFMTGFLETDETGEIAFTSLENSFAFGDFG